MPDRQADLNPEKINETPTFRSTSRPSRSIVQISSEEL